MNYVFKTLAASLLLLAAGCTYNVRSEDQPFVNEIVSSSNMLLGSPRFEDVLSGVAEGDFDHSSDPSSHAQDNGAAVLRKMRSVPTHDVVCRRAKNPFNFSTNAWEGGGTPQLRCSRFCKRSAEHWVGTLVHERAHAAGYLHRGNSRSGNQCTVPHFVGDLAVFLSQKPSANPELPKDACPALKSALGL